jgi:adenine-specific DNA-methyltransferase
LALDEPPRRPWLGENHFKTVSRARSLRARMTEVESRLWYLLRDNRFQDYKFRRQYPIGPYIADFACAKALLIIEADGGQHCENQADATRTAYMEAHGWRILRFWNNEILQQTDAVLEVIQVSLNEPSPARLCRSTSPMRER